MAVNPEARLAFLGTIVALVLGTNVAVAATQGEWRFRVLLEDDPIGHQTFRVTQQGSRARVDIDASMDVKILFLTVYSYRHHNEESWEGDCLASIASSTDDNGTPFRVNGKREGDAFVVDTGKVRASLPPCVHSFAYWDLRKLRESSLLNSQTGEFEAVRLRELGEETVQALGSERRARRYALEGPQLRIDLWYSSDDDDWLALESRSKGGRMIRYVREGTGAGRPSD